MDQRLLALGASRWLSAVRLSAIAAISFLLLVVFPSPSPGAVVPVVPTVASGYAWGENSSGELGSGTTSTLSKPTAVVLPAGVTSIAIGPDHTVAVAAGRAYAWGQGAAGQLGTGLRSSSLRPTVVKLPAGTPISAVSAAEGHSLALTDDGRVFAWGANSTGQLGDGSRTTRLTPILVPMPGNAVITSISTASDHSLAVTADGRVFAWGAGDLGQLGDGHNHDRLTPTVVPLPSGVRAAEVVAGTSHSVLLTTAGTVLVWGTTTGPRQSTPLRLALSRAVDVSAGDHHGLALLSNGTIMGWGANDLGQLGTGDNLGSATPVVVRLPGGIRVKSLSAAGDHAIALTQDGHGVLTWGDTARSVPQVVPLAPDQTLRSADAGRTGFLVVAQQGPLSRLVLNPPMAAIPAGATQAYTVRGDDEFGHYLGLLAAGVTLTMSGGHCRALVCSADVGGDQTVTATAAGVVATARVYVNGPGQTSPATGTLTSTSAPGSTAQLTTTASTTNLSDTGVSSSTPRLAAVGLILVTAGSVVLLLSRRPDGWHS